MKVVRKIQSLWRYPVKTISLVVLLGAWLVFMLALMKR